MTRRRARRALAAAMILLANPEPAISESLVVPLRRGDVGTERAFLEELLAQARLDCPGRELTLDRFQVGRVDLNDDDQYELIVSIFDSCFGGTCYHATPIYQLYHGEWVGIADLEGTNHDIDKVAHLLTDERADRGPVWAYVTVLDEKIGGWRSIVGGNYALRWSNLGIGQYGGDYDRPARPGYVTFCASDRCQHVCFRDSAEYLPLRLPYDHSGER